jgi:hypothetical protein
VLEDFGEEQPVLNTVLAAWAIHLAGTLNRTLPKETYRTYTDIISGVSLGEELPEHDGPRPTANGITVLEDVCEVHITQPGQLRPVGVVMFVRPTTKAEMPSTLVWAGIAYLRRGTPLVLVDVADTGDATVYNDLAAFLGLFEIEARRSVAAFRPVRRSGEDQVDVWADSVEIGQSLPAVPLALRGGPVVMLDLEGTYTAAIDATGL